MHFFYKICISILFVATFFTNATTLDEQYDKFLECKTDTYIDQNSGKVHGLYFEERELKPCSINNNVASFCVRDSYIGLPVSRIDIPNTYSLVLLKVDKDIKYVESYIKKNKGVTLGYNRTFTQPYLLKDPENINKTLIICELEP